MSEPDKEATADRWASPVTISLEEHVARAIIANATDALPWEKLPDEFKFISLGVARAAIAAVREREGAYHAEAMRAALREALSRIAQEGDYPDYMRSIAQAALAYDHADHAEAMRAKCEAIAQTVLEEETADTDPEGGGLYPIMTIIARIAALRGNGEGR